MWKDIITVTASPSAALLSLYVMGPRYFIGLEYGLVLALMGVIYYSNLFFFIKDIGMFTDFGFNMCTKYNIDGQSLDIITYRLVIIVRGIITVSIATIVSCSTCTSEIQDLHTLTEAYAWFDVSYFFYETWNIYENIQKYANPGPFYAHNFFSFVRAKICPVFGKFFMRTYFFFIVVFYRNTFGDCVLGLCFYKETWTIFDAVSSILVQIKSTHHLLSIFLTVLKMFTFCLPHVVMIPTLLHLYVTNSILLDNDVGANDMYTNEIITSFRMVIYMINGIWIFGIWVYYYLKHQINYMEL